MVISHLEEEAETTRCQTEKAADARIKSVTYTVSYLARCCVSGIHNILIKSVTYTASYL